jgi:hypothetical protein
VSLQGTGDWGTPAQDDNSSEALVERESPPEDETEFLLRSPANRERLLRAAANVEKRHNPIFFDTLDDAVKVVEEARGKVSLLIGFEESPFQAYIQWAVEASSTPGIWAARESRLYGIPTTEIWYPTRFYRISGYYRIPGSYRILTSSISKIRKLFGGMAPPPAPRSP